jgi:hypothetical protein
MNRPTTGGISGIAVITTLNNGTDHNIMRGGNPNAQFTERSHDIHPVEKDNSIEAEVHREQFSRALLENLVIGPEDLYRIGLLPSPTFGPDQRSRRSISGGKSPVSFRSDLREVGSSAILKCRNLLARSTGLFDPIHRAEKGEGVEPSLFREQEFNHPLLEDLVIGPEDLYRIGILPSPLREPISGFRHAGSC